MNSPIPMGKSPARAYGRWQKVVLPHAAAIVNSYSTGVTVRQLFYRLVADGTLRNTLNDYTELARATAKARVEGTFPDLIDARHDIDRPAAFDSPADALDWLTNEVYRRDRMEGQPYSIYIGNEKSGQSAQLQDWFGDRGIPVLTIGGWASTPFVQQVQQDIRRQGRPAILVYAGDFDPSGAYIGDDFATRVGLFDKVIRVGVNLTHLVGLTANPTPDKVADDPRALRFRTQFGPALVALGLALPARDPKKVEPDELVQYELDAFDPNDLRQLYEAEVNTWWDDTAYQASLKQEQADIAILMGVSL